MSSIRTRLNKLENRNQVSDRSDIVAILDAARVRFETVSLRFKGLSPAELEEIGMDKGEDAYTRQRAFKRLLRTPGEDHERYRPLLYELEDERFSDGQH